MIALLCFVLATLAAPFKSEGQLEAENGALRYQLIVLRRKVPGRVQLTNTLVVDGADICFSSILRRDLPRKKIVRLVYNSESAH